MGKSHIYSVDGMDKYLPKQVYYGRHGNILSFLDSLSESLFPQADSKYFNAIQRRNMLQLCNIARNLRLNDMHRTTIINKMNWYVDKIIKLITNNTCNYDGYCIFVEAWAWFDTNEVEITVTDCADNEFVRKYNFNYSEYISEPNYLKRQYPDNDKLLAYICNLLELYGKYFDKDDNSVGFNIHMNGEKCIGGKGFIEWF